MLIDYSWPGNIRQLENVIGRAVIMTNNKILMVSYISDSFYPINNAIYNNQPTKKIQTLDEVKMNYIIHVLNLTNGNQNMAAEMLWIDRTTLYRMLKKMK